MRKLHGIRPSPIEATLLWLDCFLDSQYMKDIHMPEYDDEDGKHVEYINALTSLLQVQDCDEAREIVSWVNDALPVSVIITTIVDEQDEEYQLTNVCNTFISAIKRTIDLINDDINISYIFYIASSVDIINFVKLIVDYSLVNISDNVVIYGLGCAIEHGHVNMFKYLIDQCQNVNIFIENNYEEILQHAVRNGKLYIIQYTLVKLLKEGGCEYYAEDVYYEIENTLVYASKHGYLHIVKYLLNELDEENVDINAAHPDDDEQTVLQCAAKNGHIEIVKFLLDERNGEKANIHAYMDGALIGAVKNEHLDIVQFLLDERNGEKADIHAREDEALIVAIGQGYLNIVQFLLEERNGENAYILAKNQQALYFAALSANVDMVRYLLEEYSSDETFNNKAIDRAYKYSTGDVRKYLQQYKQTNKRKRNLS